MKKNATTPWKRLLFYLVVNVLVSACTTLSVLWLWERGRQTPEASGAIQALETLLPREATPTVTLNTPPPPPSTGEVIRIENVIAAGDLANEVVLLQRIGDGALDLEGWVLEDEAGDQYTFPLITLYPGGAVQVHTTSGANTVTDLYWGRSSPAWQSGETVVLKDGQGNLRSTYQVP